MLLHPAKTINKLKDMGKMTPDQIYRNLALASADGYTTKERLDFFKVVFNDIDDNFFTSEDLEKIRTTLFDIFHSKPDEKLGMSKAWEQYEKRQKEEYEQRVNKK